MSWIIVLILLFASKPIVRQLDKGYKSLKSSELGNDIKSFLGEEKTSQDQNQDQQS